MTTIRASNVWDDDYIEPGDADKLRGECAGIYMELRDLDVSLKNLKYRQARCRRIYAVCVVIIAILLIVSLYMCVTDLLFDAGIIGTFSWSLLVITVIVAGISSVIFFSAMSVHSFWAWCANLLRIEKLEMQRLAFIREQSALKVRLEELEAEISRKSEI